MSDHNVKQNTRRKASSLDVESKAMLYDGCNLSELSTLFHIDHRVLVEKLRKVPADGMRNGTETWSIYVAAPHLVPVPADEIDKRIMRMNHADLPKMLTKEYWAGKRSRQEFEKQEGELWSTERVVKVIGELMKLFKMSIRLQGDAVDRQAGLSDRQRTIIKQLGDGTLNEVYRAVQKAFEEKPTNAGIQQQADDMLEETMGDVPELEDDDEL